MSEQNNTWNVRIQHKKDSAENWQSKNPVLLLNELIIVETEDGDCRIKIGDGVHAYSDLPFADQLLRDEVESKVSKEEGKALSSNDFTDDLKNKLDGISIMKGATADADGTSGLVPPPAQGADSKFLRGDGAWAAPNLPAPDRHDTTYLPENTDLNTLIDPGWYYVSTNDSAATFLNCPTTMSFALIVTKHAGCNQTLIEHTYYDYKIYTRNMYDNMWSSWNRVYTTMDKPSASDVGAAPSSHTHGASDITSGQIPILRGGTGASGPTDARKSLAVPTNKIDTISSLDQLLESGFYRVGEQADAPHAYGQIIVAHGGADTIAQISVPYHSGHGNPKIRVGNPPSVGGKGGWDGWYDILTSAWPVGIVQGGTGATSAADALNSLGAVPRVWLEQFVPWSGRASSGNISVVNGRLYNYLLFMGEPGAGEYATTLMVPSQSNGTFQLASNAASLTLTLTPSGNDVVVSIDSSQYGGALTYVFGGILAR